MELNDYPDRKRNNLRRYGITLEQYDEMMLKQNGVCAICQQHETMKNSKGIVCNLSVDHDHITGRVRGLLCRNCNIGLGCFSDNINLMRTGIAYLSKSLPL